MAKLWGTLRLSMRAITITSPERPPYHFVAIAAIEIIVADIVLTAAPIFSTQVIVAVASPETFWARYVTAWRIEIRRRARGVQAVNRAVLRWVRNGQQRPTLRHWNVQGWD